MKREKAYALRALIEQAATSLPDEDALGGVELFPAWAAGVDYAVGIRVRYDGKLYRCEQSHTSQSGWDPPAVPALWTEVAEPWTIPVWKQPTGAQDAYMAGDKVHYPTADDAVYVSDIDYNAYEPTVFGWTKEDET